MTKKILETQSLSVSYDNILALDEVSISINEKSFTSIIGPNGGGKSTLLKAFLGLVDIDAGQVIHHEKIIWGYVPQSSNFDRKFPINVQKVILMGALNRGKGFFHKYSEGDLKLKDQVLKDLDIENLENRQIGELSGGQLQRVLIARALMSEPNVLLLDEPTTGLDKASKTRLFQKLFELNKAITIIIVTHDVEDTLDYADKVIHVHKTAHEHPNLLKTGGKKVWSMPY